MSSSTTELRERLRSLVQRLSKEQRTNPCDHTNSSARGDPEKEKDNSVCSSATNTKVTCTAPSKSHNSAISATKTNELSSQNKIPAQKAPHAFRTPIANSRATEKCSKRKLYGTPMPTPTHGPPASHVQSLVRPPYHNSNSSLANEQKVAEKKIDKPTVSSQSGKRIERMETPKRPGPSASSRSTQSILVNGKKYVVIDELGRGGSSKVYQVLDEENKKLLAIKCVDLSGENSAVRNAYINEIKLLLELKNSGTVVEMFDYELRKNHLFVVMEKGDTDLATFLKTRRKQIDDIFIRFYWSEMLKCVKAIHDRGIVHSDLKPANFLLVGGNLKLIDFGIASSIPSNKTSVVKENQMGTLSYMPPEAIGGANQQDNSGREVYKIRTKSDVWALGCILFNMVYGQTPYQNYTNTTQKMLAILNKPILFKQINDENLLDVLKRCLSKDPAERANVEELQNHPYLKGNDRSALEDASMLEDDNDFLKVAEDLRNSTPRTSAHKLRILMQKRGGAQGSQRSDFINALLK